MAKRSKRIFQVAKDLNISHTEILNFLKGEGIDVASHMSPVDEDSMALIETEFSKDKENVDRYRKEQVRREIHNTRIIEQQKISKRLDLLSLDEQRKIEEEEKEKAAEEEKRKKEEKALKQQKDKKKAKETQKKEEKPKKQRLRKIDISEIESQIGQTSRSRKKVVDKKEKKVQKSVKDAVKQTLSKIDTKTKKKQYKKDKLVVEELDDEIKKAIRVAEFSNVDELSKIFDVNASDIIQECLGLGKLVTINQRMDWDIIELLADKYGFIPEKITDIGEEIFKLEDTEEDKEKATNRPPVVTIMGHVDHGKTSILDYIRKENVVAGESGGITQHIGAYKVELENDKEITFLDTPGHEAFTAMRARGAQVTDIVVVVVAANDGVMPQTMEAIDHAKAAEVPIVVAINKIDLPEADPDRVKRELSDHEVLVEDWGGKVQAVHVSAKTGEGIDDIMNSILLEAEVLELKANADTYAQGTVIDSRLDKGHGPIATVLIQKGTLNVADPFICSSYSGKVRAMMNERGQRVNSADPSEAVQVLGFDKVPQAADVFAVFENEKDLKRISSERQRMKREIQQRKVATQSLDAMSALIKDGAIKTLPLVIKGDVDGSIEVLAESLEKIKHEEVGVRVIHKAVGMVNESDVLLAAASNAVVIGFHVQVSSNAKLLANQEGVEIRSYTVIYNAVEEIKLALEGLLEPEKVENILGRASVQELFKIPKIGFIAGSKVDEGVIKRGEKARVIREEEVIHEGNVNSLKRFKDDVKEVKEGMECGIGVDDFSKFKEGDEIVVFEIQKIKRKLETA
ncbi:MAG: translation initiation factor IF-2 [Candidatus Marinimicrobia bacterium]|jgi:translation initiation factor IF-2|nr:translation initiation factor IF-2 [Candidatus Neomarinimicrobiota bacterium]MDP6499310.1 translation initiation factor IF-2 [Candidatus Neomarinimicrobiota bacterium]MDP6726306.1 translation initiation factor IF-2 [Candidatus Neomarinimicrobiota bacterium]|tara:strand:+ start:7774 stop:10170 length:2397 start_codon:yes stop_codon:yes gene_type:complete